MEIPFTDLSDCYSEIYDEVISKIKYLIDTSQFIGREEVINFEKEFAEYCNTSFSVSCGNGTDALILALLALDIKPGDTVVTVPNTFIATSEAVTRIGAKVDFVDIDEKTYTMSPESLYNYLKKNKSKKKVKAIIPVHLYGQMADMNEIKKIATEYDIKIVEDCAQAHGALYNGKKAGEIGDIGTFSFFPSKNLGAFGDAGAIVTNNEALAKKVKMLSNHGRLSKYVHEIEGFNSRLDSIQASVLRIKLKHLDNWNEQRFSKAKLYDKLLDESKLTTPFCRDNSKHVYHLYVCRSKERDVLIKNLENQRIKTQIHYPIPLHLQKAYSYLGYNEGSFPIAEKVSKEIISLPMWPQISEEHIKHICKIINSL